MTHQRELWLPSQKGGFPVRLHPHQACLPDFSQTTTFGLIPVPCLAWDPSQNGCLSERPQLHQAFFSPSCPSRTYGFFCGIAGSNDMKTPLDPFLDPIYLRPR